MTDKITKSLRPFQELFYTIFGWSSQQAIEILMMLACGHIFEIFTPNQLAQTLGIDKNKVYDAIRDWSIFLFRKMFLLVGCHLDDNVWGCDRIAVCRKEAVSPTFCSSVGRRNDIGKVVLLFFRDGSGISAKIKCIMAFGRKLRACEILSVWKQHHSIEQFWRRLKNDLQIHKVRMRGREGVHAMVARIRGLVGMFPIR